MEVFNVQFLYLAAFILRNVYCNVWFIPSILNSIPLDGLYHNLFIHSAVDGCLSYLQFLAIMNKASMNIVVQLACGHMTLLLLDIYVDQIVLRYLTI